MSPGFLRSLLIAWFAERSGALTSRCFMYTTFGTQPTPLLKTTRSQKTQSLYLPSSVTQSASSLPLALFNPAEEEKPIVENGSWVQKNTKALATGAKALAFGGLFAIALFATRLGQAYASPQLAHLNEQTSSFIAQFSDTGFYQAFSLVFLSEIGDKTFFIAGILAVKFSRVVSFLGSTCALALMTIISVVIGQVFHSMPSGFNVIGGVPLDDVAAVLAFAFFGIKLLKETADANTEAGGAMDEELADAQVAVEESGSVNTVNIGIQMLNIFGLVFAAEFGDRSFLSTIALSAAQDPFNVCLGAICAHAVATAIAVTGGAAIAKNISEKFVGYFSGVLFLVFAFTTLVGIF